MSFPNNEKICRIENPHDWSEEKSRLMVAACREMAEFHYANCPDIKFLYDKHRFDPSSVREEADLAKIPPVGVNAMKYYLLTSLPHDAAVLKLTSSGTRGQKTQVWFDQGSLDRVQAQMDGQWGQEGLVSDVPTNYLCFIYDPEQAKDLGIAFSVKNEQRFTPVRDSYFVVKKNAAGAWEFQKEATIARLREYAASGKPVRLLGIPSFIFELIQVLKEIGPIKLPANSWMLTGGGWKAAEDKSVTREQFRALVSHYLGIPDENMRDGFGMAEHSAPYMECDLHRFHIPAYNRILARDPVTMAPLPSGEKGLLELITPFNAMMPTVAILSTDIGIVDRDECPCGRKSPTFTLLGRGGLVKHKGCAITAGEIVKRS